MTETIDRAAEPFEEDEPSEEALAELARRQAAWQLSLDPRALWPTTDPGAIQDAADAIGMAVAAIVRDSRAVLCTTGIDATPLSIAALLSGVGPLLGYSVRTGALEVSDDARVVVERHFAHARVRNARIAAVMRPLLQGLASRGVVPAVMKGFHTAYAYFPDPGARPFGDVDLIVRDHEIPVATDVLRDAGFAVGIGRSKPYKRDWYPPGHDRRVRSFELWHARSNWKLELHAGIQFEHLHPYGVRLERFAEPDTLWEGHGTPVRVARGALLVAMLAVHSSGELYAMRLLRLVELILVVRRETAEGRLDWRAVETLLATAGILRFAFPAFTLTEQLAPGTIDARVLAAAARASTPRERAIVAQFTPVSPILAKGTSLSERLMWAVGWRDVLRRVWAMVTPPATMTRRDTLNVYRSRVLRVLTGGVRWRA